MKIISVFTFCSVLSASILALAAPFVQTTAEEVQEISYGKIPRNPSYVGQVVAYVPGREVMGQFWSYGKMKPFPYREPDTTITFSPWSYPSDCLQVAIGLHRYNLKQKGIEKEHSLELASPNRVKGCADLNLHNESLFVAMRKFIETCPGGELYSQVEDLMASAYEEGAKRAYLVFEGLESITPTIDFFRDGFVQCCMAEDIEGGTGTVILTKEIEPPGGTPTTQYSWEKDDANPDLVEFVHKFGFFVRNEEGQAIGGLWGHLPKRKKNDSFLCADVDIFYMSESIRGCKFGQKVMALAENWMIKKGIQVVCLDTADFQAPWFYKKWEYSEVLKLARFHKIKGGKLVNHNFFRKWLRRPSTKRVSGKTGRSGGI